jgi:CRISPR/Cas system-associated exonuclease Cas4 (RecB family)
LIRTESYSSIQCFSQCRAKYRFRYVEKIKEQDESEALRRGRNTHNSFEKRDFKDPAVKKGYQIVGLSYKVKTRKSADLLGNLYTDDQKLFLENVEFPFGIGENQEPTDFFDSRAIFRGKVDLVRLYLDRAKLTELLREEKQIFLPDIIQDAKIIDWKTGKIKNDKQQLRYYSLFFMLNFTNLQTVECQNVFVDHAETEQPGGFAINLNEKIDIWEKLISKINRIRQEQEFPPHPSGLCPSCPYTEYCKKIPDGYNSSTLHSLNCSVVNEGGALLNPFG